MNMDTAFYTFDLGRVRERVSYLRRLLGTEVALAYAVKANTFPMWSGLRSVPPGKRQSVKSWGFRRKKW